MRKKSLNKKRRIFPFILFFLFFSFCWRMFLTGFEVGCHFHLSILEKAFAEDNNISSPSTTTLLPPKEEPGTKIVSGIQDVQPIVKPKPKVDPNNLNDLSELTRDTIYSEERKLLSDKTLEMEKRKESLDQKEQFIIRQQYLLELARKKIEERQKTLLDIKKNIEQLVNDYNKNSSNSSNLIEAYAKMKPKAVANIFDKLDISILVNIINKMQPRVAGPILAEMAPGKVAVLESMSSRKSIVFQNGNS